MICNDELRVKRVNEIGNEVHALGLRAQVFIYRLDVAQVEWRYEPLPNGEKEKDDTEVDREVATGDVDIRCDDNASSLSCITSAYLR